ncbi:outer membrane lipoprotein-sorting protein [Sinimarinibacterium sp. CAU 1509]|uniref:outer membrane lipoprotein-sorting protein n=1 Tax=Sinimarinibacterium sp. CAU 1509 TaxID=2562283 RepID=UPI0010AD77D2|nr:outer membrane lipoprotein-sorting protein [Sinimarinibacterium sp. CAU 1509]TJY59943.1 outer membrane lipoprotein-sorting protein [Sinimarinibacterium sp. CAU 1509]
MRISALLPSLALAASFSVALPAHAETPAEKGLAIATEADHRDLGYGDSSATMEMILRNRAGDEAAREIRVKSLEVEGDGDKSLIIFDQPKDVEGTALLTFSHKTGDDDRWLYLPALKRVKRIAGKNKSGPFMGSEFAYEDMGSQEIEKYSYTWLRDEAVDGVNCFVIERVPADPDSGYTRQVAWIDQAEYRVQKVEFYDRKQSLLKTLTAKDYQQYQNKHWRPGRMDMVNHQTGKSTTLLFKNYVFGSGLSERDFDQASLNNAR